MRGNEDKFIIQNKINHEALFGGSYCDPERKLDKCTGYINSDYACIGRAFLTFCFSKMFNIHRLYGYEDGFMQQNGNSYDIERAFSLLTERDLIEAEEELKLMYVKTQQYLERELKSNFIKIVRALRPFEIDQIIDQIENGREEIILKTNTITSYAGDGQPFHYGASITIVRNIPIEDVVIHYKVLAYPEDTCRYSPMHGGEYEIWVKNEHPLGLIKLSRDQVCIQRERYEDYLNMRNSRSNYVSDWDEWYSQRPLLRDDEANKIFPKFYRPCINDPILKFLMKWKKYI
ncbi:hypothetical protein RZO55_14460 [Clostridium boliviensis]|uniref:Uncharacterized protein n=1 Tax=Clostridium boliviensis TaxID=318465 RepID=A0ABU4GPF0_9CLOT|nr:hypothetical protein [Clostridium boliviensis]MDW2798778.1 hypothetical protein [Clostridium boliviensis]